VVITTHDMEEAATLSNRVAIIDHGAVLALDAPDALVRGMAGERTLDCTVEPGPGAERGSIHRRLVALAPVERVEEPEDPATPGWRYRLYVHGEAAPLMGPVAQAITAAGGRLVDVRLGEPTLEDLFIHLTGRSLR
jgi:ABC-2 type transport system ATP-binding protein